MILSGQRESELSNFIRYSSGGDGSVDGFVAILIAQNVALCITRVFTLTDTFWEVRNDSSGTFSMML